MQGSIYLPFSDDLGNLNIYKTETSSFNCSANNMPIMFPTAKRSLDALFLCRRSLALILLIVRGVWGLNCPSSYLLGIFFL